MADIEKVIKGLEYCRNQAGCWSESSECPWIEECREDVNSLKDAALELLKERKRGQWTTHRTQEHDGEWYCDQCGYEPTVFEATPYCPNCGAMMF